MFKNKVWARKNFSRIRIQGSKKLRIRNNTEFSLLTAGSCRAAGRTGPPCLLPAVGQPLRPPGGRVQAGPRSGPVVLRRRRWCVTAALRARAHLGRPAEVGAGGGGAGQTRLRGSVCCVI